MVSSSIVKFEVMKFDENVNFELSQQMMKDLLAQ